MLSITNQIWLKKRFKVLGLSYYESYSSVAVFAAAEFS